MSIKIEINIDLMCKIGEIAIRVKGLTSELDALQGVKPEQLYVSVKLVSNLNINLKVNDIKKILLDQLKLEIESLENIAEGLYEEIDIKELTK